MAVIMMISLYKYKAPCFFFSISIVLIFPFFFPSCVLHHQQPPPTNNRRYKKKKAATAKCFYGEEKTALRT